MGKVQAAMKVFLKRIVEKPGAGRLGRHVEHDPRERQR
jgi:hypothetical protein